MKIEASADVAVETERDMRNNSIGLKLHEFECEDLAKTGEWSRFLHLSLCLANQQQAEQYTTSHHVEDTARPTHGNVHLTSTAYYDW